MYTPEHVVETRLIVAGEVSDFNSDALATLAANFAATISVEPDMVSVELVPASVEILFSVRVASRDDAESLIAALEPQLATPALASNLLNGAAQVEEINEAPSLTVLLVEARAAPSLPSPPSDPSSTSCRGHTHADDAEEWDGGMDEVAVACFSIGVLLSVIGLPLAGKLFQVTHRLWALPVFLTSALIVGLSAIIASDVGAARESAHAQSHYEACLRKERWRFAIINLVVALASLLVVIMRKVLLRRTPICDVIRRKDITQVRVAQAPPEPCDKAPEPPAASPLAPATDAAYAVPASLLSHTDVLSYTDMLPAAVVLTVSNS